MRSPAAFGLLAMLLYLPGFWWGAPHASAPDRKQSWGVDDETPLGPLAELHNIVHPKSDRNLGYPLLYSFIVAAAYAPYLGYLWLTGQLTRISAVYPFGLTDPVRTLAALTYIAHLVTVSMAAVVAAAAYETARALWDRRTAALAGLLAMTAFPMFYYARTGNVDVPVLCFTALALAVFARALGSYATADGRPPVGLTVGRAACMGLFVGCALATKEPAFAAFLAVPVVLAALQWRSRAAARPCAPAFAKAAVMGACTTAVAFGLGSGLFVDPGRYVAHVAFARQRLETLTAGNVAYLHTVPFSVAGAAQFAGLVTRYLGAALTAPGLALACVGAVWVLRRETLQACIGLPAVTYVLVLFCSARTAQLRYLLPVDYVLTLFAARAVVLGWGTRRPWLRGIFALAAGAVLATNLLRGADLTWAMIHDSRYAAGAWLRTHAQVGDHLEYFGPAGALPPLEAAVVATPAVPPTGPLKRPRIGAAAAEEIRDAWRRRRPRFVLIMPDLLSPPGGQHAASCPPQTYDELLSGALGYQLAATFQTPPLLPWLRRPALDYPTVNPPIRIFVRGTEPTSATERS